MTTRADREAVVLDQYGEGWQARPEYDAKAIAAWIESAAWYPSALEMNALAGLAKRVREGLTAEIDRAKQACEAAETRAKEARRLAIVELRELFLLAQDFDPVEIRRVWREADEATRERLFMRVSMDVSALHTALWTAFQEAKVERAALTAALEGERAALATEKARHGNEELVRAVQVAGEQRDAALALIAKAHAAIGGRDTHGPEGDAACLIETIASVMRASRENSMAEAAAVDALSAERAAHAATREQCAAAIARERARADSYLEQQMHEAGWRPSGDDLDVLCETIRGGLGRKGLGATELFAIRTLRAQQRGLAALQAAATGLAESVRLCWPNSEDKRAALVAFHEACAAVGPIAPDVREGPDFYASSNAEAGDASVHCAGCDEERDDGHTYDECIAVLRADRERENAGRCDAEMALEAEKADHATTKARETVLAEAVRERRRCEDVLLLGPDPDAMLTLERAEQTEATALAAYDASQTPPPAPDGSPA